MRWVVVVVLVAALIPGGAHSSEAGPEQIYRPPYFVHRAFVREDGVNYAGLASHADALTRLVREIEATSGATVRQYSKSDRIAFWVNAYNLLTLDLIVAEWRVRGGRLHSIKDIAAAWSRPRWTVGGRSLTLDKIEHDVLRKEFREPRVHFALVCASKSCPALQRLPFLGVTLDAQLDSAAREFVLDPSRNDFTPRDGAIRVSKIFDWYGKDFVGVYSDSTFERLYGRETGAVLAYVTRFLPAETVAALRAKRARVTYLPYDWALNIAPPR